MLETVTVFHEVSQTTFTYSRAALRAAGQPGLASVCFLWPAIGAETSLYLKELYVQEDYRRCGVARELMVAVRNEAQAAGCSRIEWTADRDNPPAVALYAALGVEPHEGKIFYRSQT